MGLGYPARAIGYSAIWRYLANNRKPGNVAYAIINGINTNGTKSSDTSQQHTDTQKGYQMQDGDIIIKRKIHQPNATGATNKPGQSAIGDIQHEGVETYTGNGESLWGCGYCERKFEMGNKRGLTTHIGKMHGEIETTDIQRPYCPSSFKTLQTRNNTS